MKVLLSLIFFRKRVKSKPRLYFVTILFKFLEFVLVFTFLSKFCYVLNILTVYDNFFLLNWTQNVL